MSNPVTPASAADVAAIDAKVSKVIEMLARLLDAQVSAGSAEAGAVTVATAAKQTGLGKTTLYALISDGSLKSCKVGKRRLIPRTELARLLAQPQN